jgi:hypothetical protein
MIKKEMESATNFIVKYYWEIFNFVMLGMMWGLFIEFIYLWSLPQTVSIIQNEATYFVLLRAAILGSLLEMIGMGFQITPLFGVIKFKTVVKLEGVIILILGLVCLAYPDLSGIFAIWGLSLTMAFILIDLVMIRQYDKIRSMVDAWRKKHDHIS